MRVRPSLRRWPLVFRPAALWIAPWSAAVSKKPTGAATGSVRDSVECKMRLTVLFAIACLTGLASEAAAFDCAKARTDTEKDICASPELKAADDAMSAAYAAALPRLAPPQQALLKSNQRAWLKQLADSVRADEASCPEVSAWQRQLKTRSR